MLGKRRSFHTVIVTVTIVDVGVFPVGFALTEVLFVTRIHVRPYTCLEHGMKVAMFLARCHNRFTLVRTFVIIGTRTWDVILPRFPTFAGECRSFGFGE